MIETSAVRIGEIFWRVCIKMVRSKQRSALRKQTIQPETNFTAVDLWTPVTVSFALKDGQTARIQPRIDMRCDTGPGHERRER